MFLLKSTGGNSCNKKSKRLNSHCNKKSRKLNSHCNKKSKRLNSHCNGGKINKKKSRKCPYDKVVIKKSTNNKKKKMAIFTNSKNNKKKTTHFGANGMSDYTIHHDDERKKRYLNRHKKRENWNDCSSAGALSRWILWNKKSLSGSIKDFKSKFNL